MIAGPAFVTPHAVHRFLSRMGPRIAEPLSFDDARAEIIAGLRDGVRSVSVPRTQPDGKSAVYVRCVGPRARFVATVVFGDRSKGDAPIVVTVRSWMRGTSAGKGRPRRKDRERAL